MPVYEYQCAGCGKTYDILHLGREKTEDIVCPSCHSKEHKKLMSAASVATKGGGGDPGPSCTPDTCCGGSCGMN